MAIGPEQQRLTPGERANLVAYLDGELSEAEHRAIATKLTLSPTARREVEQLEKIWELLDHLPRPRASEQFTERTLTGVRLLDTRGDRIESALKQTAGRLGWTLGWVVASALAFGVGFAALQWLWPDPTARLARDLPLAEHFNEYRDVRSIEFLKELMTAPEFSGDRAD